MELLQGDRIDFTCVSASPVIWSFDGHTIEKNSFKFSKNSTIYKLALHNVDISNSGIYTCLGKYLHKKAFFRAYAKLVVLNKGTDKK